MTDPIVADDTAAGLTEPAPAPSTPPGPPTLKLGAAAVGAIALGAVAIGALAIGRLVIGRMAVGRLAIGKAALGRARLHHLEIDELVVRHLHAPGLKSADHHAVEHGERASLLHMPSLPHLPRLPRGWRWKLRRD